MSILNEAIAFYDDSFLPKDVADRLFVSLSALDWSLRNVKGLPLRRETCVYADKGLTEKAPVIWGDEAVVNEWTLDLLFLKSLVEAETGETYNICLGNRYVNKKQYIAFHSDNEEYGTTKSIASVSLGTPRTFTFHNKDVNSGEKVQRLLSHGSLLFMGENCQEQYRHGMKKESVDKQNQFGGQRINITFRKFIYNKNN